MTLFELFLLAIGLSMDAFAVAICCGLRRCSFGRMVTVGLYFGVFQSLMPLGGYFLGGELATFAHWLAPIILFAVGGNMLVQSRKESELVPVGESHSALLLLALATSIDAFVVGVSLVYFEVSILPTVLLIGLVTCGCSMTGVKLGNLVGGRYQSRAELLGGVILIFIGLKSLF